jgi:phosphocarrier protein
MRVAVEVEGWNAEAAIGFALAAKKFASSVTLSRGRDTADGRDEVEVLTLGPEPGDEVLLEVEGRDEKDAFKALLARLLWVIEKPKSKLDAVLGLRPDEQAAPESKRAVGPFRRRVAEVAALDVEEVAPVRPRRKKARCGQFREVRPLRGRERVDYCIRHDSYPAAPDRPSARRKKRAYRKSERKPRPKPTTRRKPRKRKK